MFRIVAAAVLSLLLVGMQREALVHEVDHLRAKIAVGHDVVLQNAAIGECAQCALLASGTTPAPSSPTVFAVTARDDAGVVASFATAAVASRPAPYQSRAPPIAL